MKGEKLIEQIALIEKQIEKLPKGYLSQKVINGKIYYYHQWSEKGVKKGKYVSGSELHNLFSLFALKKELQSRLFDLKKGREHVGKYQIIKCTLMHKNTLVVDIDVDNQTGSIVSIKEIYSLPDLPIGINQSSIDKDLSRWWNERSIPLSRSGLAEALDQLELPSPRSLLVKCFGLSLSDQYWIKPKDTNITWKQVNFFDNDFSEDLGELLFGKQFKKGEIKLESPDSTSIGNLKKRWKIIDGCRYLIKGGSNPFRQEPINEVVASRVMDILKIPHVNYTPMFSGGYPYSECEDFINKNQDFVSAQQICDSFKRSNDVSLYQHFINCSETLGLKDAKEYLNKMIVLDFIIANEDRHLNNFGAIRNANTLTFVGFAPIFDSGASFGFDKLPSDFFKEELTICKPFRKTHKEQLKLVTSFDFLDENKLNIVLKTIQDTFYEFESEYLSKDRIEAIIKSLEQRINHLKALIK